MAEAHPIDEIRQIELELGSELLRAQAQAQDRVAEAEGNQTTILESSRNQAIESGQALIADARAHAEAEAQQIRTQATEEAAQLLANSQIQVHSAIDRALAIILGYTVGET